MPGDNFRGESNLDVPIEHETWTHTGSLGTEHPVSLCAFGESFYALREQLIHEATEPAEEKTWEKVSGMEEREQEIDGYPSFLAPVKRTGS